MKFGQLIKYNRRNTFLEKSYVECGGETSPRPFSDKSKLGISLDPHSEILGILFLLYVQVKYYQSILKLRCGPLEFTSYKAFSKHKKKSGTSFPALFSVSFIKKNIYCGIFY